MNRRFSASGLFLAAVGGLVAGSGVAGAEGATLESEEVLYDFLQTLSYEQKEKLYGYLTSNRFGLFGKKFSGSDVDAQLDAVLKKNVSLVWSYVKSNFASAWAAYSYFKKHNEVFNNKFFNKVDAETARNYVSAKGIDIFAAGHDNLQRIVDANRADANTEDPTRLKFLELHGLAAADREQFRRNPLRYIDTAFRLGLDSAKGKNKQYIDGLVMRYASSLDLDISSADFSKMSYEDICGKIRDDECKEEFKKLVIGTFVGEELPLYWKTWMLDKVYRGGRGALKFGEGALDVAFIGGAAYAAYRALKWLVINGVKATKGLLFGGAEDEEGKNRGNVVEDDGPIDVWMSYAEYEANKAKKLSYLQAQNGGSVGSDVKNQSGGSSRIDAAGKVGGPTGK